MAFLSVLTKKDNEIIMDKLTKADHIIKSDTAIALTGWIKLHTINIEEDHVGNKIDFWLFICRYCNPQLNGSDLPIKGSHRPNPPDKDTFLNRSETRYNITISDFPLHYNRYAHLDWVTDNTKWFVQFFAVGTPIIVAKKNNAQAKMDDIRPHITNKPHDVLADTYKYLKKEYENATEIWEGPYKYNTDICPKEANSFSFVWDINCNGMIYQGKEIEPKAYNAFSHKHNAIDDYSLPNTYGIKHLFTEFCNNNNCINDDVSNSFKTRAEPILKNFSEEEQLEMLQYLKNQAKQAEDKANKKDRDDL